MDRMGMFASSLFLFVTACAPGSGPVTFAVTVNGAPLASGENVNWALETADHFEVINGPANVDASTLPVSTTSTMPEAPTPGAHDVILTAWVVPLGGPIGASTPPSGVTRQVSERKSVTFPGRDGTAPTVTWTVTLPSP
jgi:hypothetical protein